MSNRKPKLPLPIFLAIVIVGSWLALDSLYNRSVRVTVDLRNEIGTFDPTWAWFGYDEANYTTTASGRALLKNIDALETSPYFIRTHNLLTSGDGQGRLKWSSTNAYTEDSEGNPVYDWRILDGIVDTLKEHGATPFMEIGFMPKALSRQPEPYEHHWKTEMPYGSIFTGWTQPPTDYEKWAGLVRAWAEHSVERYGIEEVRRWYWGVWNEPNIPYWAGTPEEYFKLYDYTAEALKAVIPDAKIGGPHVTGCLTEASREFLRRFLLHCAEGKNAATGKRGAPLDFVTFHAKGTVDLEKNGKTAMQLVRHLREMDQCFGVIASIPTARSLPVILGESDPEGCAACNASAVPANRYRNGTMYASYTAALIARMNEIASANKVNLMGAVTWAFVFEGEPWFAGFRALASNGVPKPIFNLFRMLAQMSGTRVGANSSQMLTTQELLAYGVRETPDVGVLAVKRKDGVVALLVWNHLDWEGYDRSALVDVSVRGVDSDTVQVEEFRLDSTHGNSFSAWQGMGAPERPTDEQQKILLNASKLEVASRSTVHSKNGQVDFSTELDPHAVHLYLLKPYTHS